VRYKGSDKALSEIAAERRVDTVIEGSVTREDDKVAITAQLIEEATDQSPWAERYQRDVTSILKLHAVMAPPSQARSR
jgi:TolB-like protein